MGVQRQMIAREGRNIRPHRPAAHFGWIADGGRLFRVNTLTGIEVEGPVMPRAAYHGPVHLSARQIASGMGAGIVQHRCTWWVVQSKHGQLSTETLQVDAAIRRATVPFNQSNPAHQVYRTVSESRFGLHCAL